MIIEYFNENQHSFWFSVGFLLLALEAVAFGFTTGVVLFAGIGGLITGTLMWLGLLPATWLAGFACFGISSGVSTALLWKSFIKLQNKPAPEKDNSSDLIGYSFRTQMPLTLTEPGSVNYSGIEWRVEIADEADVEEITSGTKVEVVSVDAGVFRVKLGE